MKTYTLSARQLSLALFVLLWPIVAVTAQTKLTASDAAPNDLFGHSISLSGDTAIVGAYLDDNNGGVDAGSAYVFTRSGSVWTQQQKLMASDAAAGDFFGFSVSVSGDTAVIGSINDKNSGGQTAGSAYIFTRSGGVWTQQQRLQPSDAALNDAFGYSVSLEGGTVVISSVGDDDGGQGAGSAYVFTRNGGAWTQQQWLQASDRKASANFGHSLSLSSDTVIIGAWADSNPGGVTAGAAYIFTSIGDVWTQQQKLTASDAASHDSFGWSVSLGGDTAVVGAISNDGGGSDAGATYVFTRSTGVWTQQQRLPASDAAVDDVFGQSVSVAGDTAVIGAAFDNNSGGVDAGSSYVFTRSAGAWGEQKKLVSSDAAAGDNFGVSISMSGNTVLIGAEMDDNSGGADAGSAYVVVLESNNSIPVVNAGHDQSATENVVFNLTASFTDTDASDSHSSTVNWGDGSSISSATVNEPFGATAGTITASHTYPTPGNYTVMVTVMDAANVSGSDTLQVTVGPSLTVNYIQNTTTQQANANFNVSGNGIVGGNLSVGGSLNGSGSGLTNLNASNITTGTLDNSRLGAIETTNVADSAITSSKIADGAVTAVKISNNQVVKNLNGLSDTVNLAAGANVTITPSGNTLTIATASGNFIQNTTTQQPASNFNISGNGEAANVTASNMLSGNTVNAMTQFNISGTRVLSIAGSHNIFVGDRAGNTNTTGSDNTFAGTSAGYSNSIGYQNAFVGTYAGFSNSEGNNNSFGGYASGYSNTTGSSNSFYGGGAGQANTTGNANTFFGVSAGRNNISASESVFVGTNAGYGNTTGSGNSFVGTNAGYSNTTGYGNSYFGNQAGMSNTTEFGNSFFGFGSGMYTTGNSNSFFGFRAGLNNTTGYSNQFFGYNAGSANTTGSGGTFIGTSAGVSNATGFNNVFVGSFTGNINTSGYNNTFVGAVSGGANTTGLANTLIGAYANVASSGIFFGTAIGAEATVSTSNTVVIGRSAAQDTVQIPGLLKLNTFGTAGGNALCRNASNQVALCSSSLRYKTNIAPFTFGMNVLRRLRPIRFEWKDGGMKDLGFGAEEVAAIEPLLVTYNANGEVEGVKYDRISAVFVNAFKEQQAQIEAQQAQLKSQYAQITTQQQQLNQQQAIIEGMKRLLCKQYPTTDFCR